MEANFKDGIIRDGNRMGSGTILGNIKDHIVRKGTSSVKGLGDIQGNIKDGIIRQGTSSSVGHGTIILNIKDGIVITNISH